MKTPRPLSAIFALILLSTDPGWSQESPPKAEVRSAVSAVAPECELNILDDQSGVELKVKHGINPITLDDLRPLVDGVLNSAKSTRIRHWVVDEDASDTEATTLDLLPYNGGKPPALPSSNLPTYQLADAVKSYREKRAEWQTGMVAFRDNLQAATDRFVHDLQLAQIRTSERFDLIADELARQGRNPDFRRSDIGGAIRKMTGQAGAGATRILLLNSDCVDAPRDSQARRTPFTGRDLPEDVVLVFVNTSGIPDKSPLFAELKNPRHHAASMAEAVKLVIPLLNGTPLPR